MTISELGGFQRKEGRKDGSCGLHLEIHAEELAYSIDPTLQYPFQSFLVGAYSLCLQAHMHYTHHLEVDDL
ncbi:unnamed protein product [Sphagnum jensenii]|uniref:Uncharacterized protein n=1 Tax=Sphagnum jensenii TaxID=128206 RepID=A0ABP0VS05_9BRYO